METHILDQIHFEVMKVLSEHQGIRATFEGSQFVLTYLKCGIVRELPISLIPPKYTSRENFYTKTVPQMNAMAEALEGFAKGLNDRFQKDFVNLAREAELAKQS